MSVKEKINYKLILVIIIFILLIAFLTYIFTNKSKNEKDANNSSEPIIVNLLTSVHPNLPWVFKSVKSEISIIPGEITTIEYFVENSGNKTTTGISTFSYFPRHFGIYISKLNCFCYGAQTLKANEKDKYSLTLLIDPEVTKDSKTKDIKEVTIQFTFFDYKEYKENKS
jgi:cytochrome c oxidase assembly protein subunit 11